MIYQKSFRSVFNLTAHLVFVTKYRRKVFSDSLLVELNQIFASILNARGCQLLEFNGEVDYVHLLATFRPEIALSNLVANLKATSSKQLWLKHPEYLEKFYYGKKVLWTGSYFVASCGGVTIEQLKKYVQNQSRPE